MTAARVALIAVLYPVALVASLDLPARFHLATMSEDQGPYQIAIALALAFLLGAIANTWWALLVPPGWAAAAILLGWGFPVENTDPSTGVIWLAIVLAAGIAPVAVGVLVRRAVRAATPRAPA